MVNAPQTLAIVNLRHQAPMQSCLKSALFLESSLATHLRLYLSCGVPTMWCPWLYSVHPAAVCPTLALGWMRPFVGFGGGASLPPHGFPTPPSQHQGCLCDPSHFPVHLESFSVAFFITFPKVRWLYLLQASSHSHQPLSSSATKSKRERVTCGSFAVFP